MTTIVLRREGRGVPHLQDLLVRAGLWWEGVLARRAERRALARLGPRLLRDIGIEPATPEGWEALRPNGMLVQWR